MPSIDYKSTASKLVSGEPLSYKPYPDGSFVVIGPSGMKYKFTKDDVEKTLPKQPPKLVSKLLPVPDPMPESKPQPKRGRPPKK